MFKGNAEKEVLEILKSPDKEKMVEKWKKVIICVLKKGKRIGCTIGDATDCIL